MKDDIEKAFRHFKKVDPILHTAAHQVRHTLTFKKAPQSEARLFTSLAESIVSQQLSVKAADAIWARVKEACGGRVTVRAILATRTLRLRNAGLSNAKVKTLKALAMAINKGLRLSPLKKVSPEEAIEVLTQVWGIGPWTAEMFLMFGLQHPDIFSKGDLGLIRAVEMLYKVKNPSAHYLERLTLVWSPHRTLAARILWRVRDSL